jgi:competence protein ComEA
MKPWQLLVIGVLCGILMGGIIFLVASRPSQPSLEIISPTQVTSIVVSVAGEVVHPGVYTLPAGARVNDALQTAGGMTADADASAINLAETLEDGQQIYLPSSISTPTLTSEQGKININTASLEELEALPGIGAAKAQAIIDYRNKYGNFQSIDDLLYISGFGPAIIQEIEDSIKVR